METFGLYCVLVLLKHLCDKFDITEGRVTIGCDCLSALNDCISSEDAPMVNKKDYDLIKSI